MTILFGRTQQSLETPFEPLRNPGFGPAPSVLTSLEAQSAIEEVYFKLTTQLTSEIRLVLLNLYNGTLTNNSFLGRSELHPSTPIRFARKVVINELSFQNQNVAKNFFLDIYKNGQAIGNLLSTLTINTGAAGTGQTFQGLNLTFAADDTLFFRYRSISGTSPSDSSIELYCRVTA